MANFSINYIYKQFICSRHYLWEYVMCHLSHSFFPLLSSLNDKTFQVGKWICNFLNKKKWSVAYSLAYTGISSDTKRCISKTAGKPQTLHWMIITVCKRNVHLPLHLVLAFEDPSWQFFWLPPSSQGNNDAENMASWMCRLIRIMTMGWIWV